MSKNTKIIIGVIVVVLVVILIGWWLVVASTPTAVAVPISTINTTTVPSGADVTSSPHSASSAAASTNAGLTTSPSDSSNAALNADMNSIDAQQGSFTNDAASINQN